MSVESVLVGKPHLAGYSADWGSLTLASKYLATVFGAVVALTAAEIFFHAMAGWGAFLRTVDDASFFDGASAVVEEYVDGAHCGGSGESVYMCLF